MPVVHSQGVFLKEAAYLELRTLYLTYLNKTKLGQKTTLTRSPHTNLQGEKSVRARIPVSSITAQDGVLSTLPYSGLQYMKFQCAPTHNIILETLKDLQKTGVWKLTHVTIFIQDTDWYATFSIHRTINLLTPANYPIITVTTSSNPRYKFLLLALCIFENNTFQFFFVKNKTLLFHLSKLKNEDKSSAKKRTIHIHAWHNHTISAAFVRWVQTINKKYATPQIIIGKGKNFNKDLLRKLKYKLTTNSFPYRIKKEHHFASPIMLCPKCKASGSMRFSKENTVVCNECSGSFWYGWNTIINLLPVHVKTQPLKRSVSDKDLKLIKTKMQTRLNNIGQKVEQ
jgi:hypothetical protein